MHEIVVLSGKGGSGKTSVTAALAYQFSRHEPIVLCDYDVDAPDMHIIARPQIHKTHEFISGTVAVFNEDACIDCGQCLNFCRFDAITNDAPGSYPVIESACEGCTVCVKLCPMDAFVSQPRHCGQYFESDSRFGPFVHARLSPGSENSGRLITLLKEQAKIRAHAAGAELILSDGTPGIGCPVISSLSGATLVCAVVETTASGLADFERLAQLCRHFRLPVAVILNKADLDGRALEKARQVIDEQKAVLLGELPFTPIFTAAMTRGQAVGETPSELDAQFASFAHQLKQMAEARVRSRGFIPIKEI